LKSRVFFCKLVTSSDYENISNKASPSKSQNPLQPAFDKTSHPSNEIKSKTPIQSPKSLKRLEKTTAIIDSRSSVLSNELSNSESNLKCAVNQPQAHSKKQQIEKAARAASIISITSAGDITTIPSTQSKSMPSSKSYIINPNYSSSTACIMSNPPPVSPTAFLSSKPPVASASSAHITSIITNPSYYTNSSQSANYEYVRSPHGVYTRINSSSTETTPSKNVKKSPSFRILSKASASQMPQSTSSFIISSLKSPAKLITSSKSSSPSNSNNSVVVHPSKRKF
jgi:hypothetical protein